MSELPTGTPQPSEQPGNGTQTPEQAAVNPGQQSQAAPPTIEQLQAQLQQEQSARQQQDQSYRALQADYTRKAQALAQLAGSQAPPQAPPDPIAPYVQKIVAQGYSEKDARVIAQSQYEMTQSMVAPLQQQIQQGYQQTQQLTQVDNLLNGAYREDPTVFPDQKVYDQVRQAAINYTQQGGQLDSRMIRSIANDAAYWARQGQPLQQQPPPQAMQPLGFQPFRNGQNIVTPGYQPPMQQGNAPLTGAAAEVEAAMKSRFTPNSK